MCVLKKPQLDYQVPTQVSTPDTQKSTLKLQLGTPPQKFKPILAINQTIADKNNQLMIK
jgi:hypothetical protein